MEKIMRLWQLSSKLCMKIFSHKGYDLRFLVYIPFVIAAAALFLVIKEIDPNNAFDYPNKMKDFLEIMRKGRRSVCMIFSHKDYGMICVIFRWTLYQQFLV